MTSLGTGLPAQSGSFGSGGLQLGIGGQLGSTSSQGPLSGALQTGISGLTSGGLQTGKPFGGGLQLGPKPTGGTAATSSVGLQLGSSLPPYSQQLLGGGLQLGPKPTGGTAATSVGLQLGSSLPSYSQQPLGGGLQLGAKPTSGIAATSSVGLQLGSSLPSYTQQPLGGGLQLGAKTTGGTAATSVGLQLGSSLPSYTQQPLGGGLQLGAGLPKPTTGVSSVGPQLGQTTAVSKPVLGATAPTTGLQTSAASSLGGLPGLSATAGKTGLLTSVATTTSSGGLTGSGGGGGVKQYTYKELEDLINKWSIELQGQEKLFLQEAQQINSWDRLLAENGDKITELNDEVERVKSEQQRLDSELDLINSQQTELEEILSALEVSVSQQQPLATSHHADLERTKIYQLAESVDGQLRRMEQDLKEIIEQMNSANTAEDEDSPMVKVVKILNAHADSLNWIDRNTALLRQKVEEVGKQTEQRRREQERSFRLAFDQ